MNWEVLLMALIAVESGGDPTAVNQEEMAYGILQIRPILVEDVNRLYPMDEPYQHKFLLVSKGESKYRTSMSEYNSRNICLQYLIYWGARMEGETGCEPTYEDYARIWNGGPRGWCKNSTKIYWSKVEKEIKRIEEEVSN